MDPKTTSKAWRGWVVLALALTASMAPRPATAQGFDVVEATIADAHDAMRAGTLTCRALVEAYLRRIDAYDQKGPRLNTVQNLNPRALQLADSLDAALAAGAPLGPLHCVPVLLPKPIYVF